MAGWLARIFVDEPSRTGPRPRPPPNSITVIQYDEARAMVLRGRGRDRCARAGDAGKSMPAPHLRSVRRCARSTSRPTASPLSCRHAPRSTAWRCRPPSALPRSTVPDASHDLVMLADPARLIVGDTSATTRRCGSSCMPRRARPIASSACSRARGSSAAAPRRVGLVVRADRSQTAVVTLSGLTPATQHDIELRLVQPDNVERVIARGSVRTLPADPRRLTHRLRARATCPARRPR